MDLVEGDPVAAIVADGSTHRDFAARKYCGHDLGKLANAVVIGVVADIEDLAIDSRRRRLERAANCLADVFDVHERSPRTAVAGHGDLLLGPGQGAKIIEDDVKAHAR